MDSRQSPGSDPVLPAGMDTPPAGQDTGIATAQLAEATAKPEAKLSRVKSSGAAAPRSLKLVLTLTPAPAAPAAGSGVVPEGAESGVPAEERTYHALVSIGSDGCDPILRSIGESVLSAILDDIPGLVTEAGQQWTSRPRFPRASAPAKSAPAPRTPERRQKPAGNAPSDAGAPAPILAVRPAVEAVRVEAPPDKVDAATAEVTGTPAPSPAPAPATQPESHAATPSHAGLDSRDTNQGTAPVITPVPESPAPVTTPAPTTTPATTQAATAGQLTLFG